MTKISTFTEIQSNRTGVVLTENAVNGALYAIEACFYDISNKYISIFFGFCKNDYIGFLESGMDFNNLSDWNCNGIGLKLTPGSNIADIAIANGNAGISVKLIGIYRVG